MSGAQAAAASGCCCRPLIGCPCDNPNRPGAIFDASLSSVLVSMDVSISHACLNDVTTNGCPGQPCDCFAQPSNPGQAILYGYQTQGRAPDPDLDCTDSQGNQIQCVKGSCPGCYPFYINANAQTAILTRQGQQGWRTVSASPLEHTIGNWSWQAVQAGWCPSTDGSVRVRRYCPFAYLDTAGGIRPGVLVDRNGQYVDEVTYEYTTGLHGSNIGAIYAVVDVTLGYYGSGYGGAECGYEAVVRMHYLSLASLLDAVSGGGLLPSLESSLALTWHYRKQCLSPSDTALGTYVLVSPADIERYSEFQPCGPSYAFDDLRATAGDTLTVS